MGPLVTRGVRTSEFKVALLAVIGAIVSATQDYISNPTATKLSIGAAVAYILSRGLAKYETSTSSQAPPPASPPTPPAG